VTEWLSKRMSSVSLLGTAPLGRHACSFPSHRIHSSDYTPTVFDNYIHTVLYEGKTTRLCLWDTSGQEEFERMRTLSYHNANVFLVCAAVDNRTSFENIKTKWIPELTKSSQGSRAPLVIIGTKSDLRNDRELAANLVPRGDIEAVVKAVGAAGYIECSAKDHTNIKEVFQAAIKQGLESIKAARGLSVGGATRPQPQAGSAQPATTGPPIKNDQKCCCAIS